MNWYVTLTQRAPARYSFTHDEWRVLVAHCSTVQQAVRTAQRMAPGYTAVAAEMAHDVV
jgi:hypothetical protein